MDKGLEPGLQQVFDRWEPLVRERSRKRRRRELGLAPRPSEFPYLRSKEQVDASLALEKRKFPEVELLPRPYKSLEDLLTERLESCMANEKSTAEAIQLSFFQEAAE